MKKKLEAELISIAHRILKLKNKSELDQLYFETQKLYEKLAVLKFVEENFADAKPTIGRAGVEEILETAFDNQAEEAPQPEIAAPAEEVQAAEPVVAQDARAEDKLGEAKPQPDKEDDKDDESDEQKIQEPEKPEEEKLAPDATPIEKEADQVIAEAEEAVADETTDEPTQDATDEKPEEAPVTEAGIAFEQPEATEEIAAAAPEDIKQEDLFKPSFEWAFDTKADEKTEEQPRSQQTSQVAFEDLLGAGYKDPVFVKPEDEANAMTKSALDKETDVPAENNWLEPKKDVIPITRRDDKVPVFKMNAESGTLNDRMAKGITVGLNDRIAFVKNLFNNSNEDYNRVLSQLLTFDTLEQAQDFIDNMVKPDYNNWEGKDEYAQRFMEVVEKKFS
jgi:hypothetical protein